MLTLFARLDAKVVSQWKGVDHTEYGTPSKYNQASLGEGVKTALLVTAWVSHCY